MHLFLAFLITGFIDQPGPLDAYRANFSSIKAECEYIYIGGQLDQTAFDETAVWQGKGIAIVEDRRKHIDGRWSCDGSAECVFNTPDPEISSGQLKAIAESRTPSGRFQFAPRIELLTDGKRRAYTDMVGKMIHLEYAPGTPQLVWAKTPLFRWQGEDLPNMLRLEYSGISPARAQVVRGGRFLEVEVYRKDIKGGWRLTEIGYDSTVGYLPRFCRDIQFSSEKNLTFLYEKYLVEVTHCKAGGFVPLEWYDFVLDLRGFDINAPGYSPCMSLPPSEVRHAGHFKVSKFADRTSAAALESLAAATTIAVSVDRFVRRKSLPPKLTLDQIEATLNADLGTGRSLGGKFKPVTGVARHNIDRDELNEIRDEPRSYWGATLVAVIVGIAAAVAFATRGKWRGTAVGILLLMIVPGCRKTEPPMIELEAGLKDYQVISDPRESKFATHLKIINAGNCPARILAVDGGCTCRKVDQAGLPRSLAPGDSFTTRVDMGLRLQYEPQFFNFSIQTDNGTFAAPTKLLAIPRSCLEPLSIANTSLRESDGWTFEICHREVAGGVGSTTGNRIVFPEDFETSRLSEEITCLDAAPGVLFKECKYQVTLKNMSLGECKSSIRIVDDKNRDVVATPVVWVRSPFISSAPTRVTMSSRPVRVFLKCPDEAVELSRVLSSPEGIKAVISSPRESTIMLRENAAGVISGFIEVATTARDRPPLRVPVVRYAPSRRRSALPG